MRLSISVCAPEHGDEIWHAIDPAIRDAVVLQMGVTCPNLATTCTLLLKGIINGNMLGAEDSGHRDPIEEHGGVDAVVTEILGHIDPHIKSLEGKELSRQSLDYIRSQQTDPWPEKIGYLDYVTDSRLEEYFRIYVGQSGHRLARIMQQHIQSVLQSKRNSLHYFILWIGNGFRSANFLRLWSFQDDEPVVDWYHTKCDILELLLCVFFDSLSLQSIIIQKRRDENPTTWGLNVLTPLYQHKPMSECRRLPFIWEKQRSLDPQIRLWATQRATPRQRKKKKQQRPPWTHAQYLNAIQEAVGEANFRAIESCLRREITAVPQVAFGLNRDAVKPYGSLLAPIGFVLDYFVANGYTDADIAESTNSINVLPWALSESGFNQNNVLVWSFDFQKHSSLSPADFSQPNLEGADPGLRESHQAVIKSSGVKVLFLCGARAKKAILASVNCPPRRPEASQRL